MKSDCFKKIQIGDEICVAMKDCYFWPDNIGSTHTNIYQVLAIVNGRPSVNGQFGDVLLATHNLPAIIKKRND